MRRGERGSTIPLIVGFTMVLLMAAVVVIDASAAWIQRQSLNSLAEGAALHAADRGAEGTEIYGEGLGAELHLDPAVARAAVEDYLTRAAARQDHPGITSSVEVGRDRITVRLRAPLDLPLQFPGATIRSRVSGHGAAVTSVDPAG